MGLRRPLFVGCGASLAIVAAGVIGGLNGVIGFALGALFTMLVTRGASCQYTRKGNEVTAPRHAASVRDDLLEIVAHDLRSPLSAITITTELLARTHADPAAGRQLEILRFAAKRMQHLVDEIADGARLEAGGLRVDALPCDLLPLLSEVAMQFEGAALRHDLSLRCEAEPHAVIADRARVAQVLSNLIGNAIKFTPAGGVVNVRTQANGDSIIVSVEDSGPGIEHGDLEHVFDRYWRGSHANGTRGLGLGLYICKRLVEAQRGRIWVVSRRDRGTHVLFSLPRAEAEEGR